MRLGLYSAIQWNRNFSSFTDIPIPLYFSIGKDNLQCYLCKVV